MTTPPKDHAAENCAWCGQPPTAHHVTGLCNVPGVTSQYYTPKPGRTTDHATEVPDLRPERI